MKQNNELNITPPLLELYLKFNNRTENKFKLSIDSYFDLIKTLKSGYGLISAEDLWFVCKTLWVKSVNDEYSLRKLFDEYLNEVQTKEELKDFENIDEQIKKNKGPDRDNDLQPDNLDRENSETRDFEDQTSKLQEETDKKTTQLSKEISLSFGEGENAISTEWSGKSNENESISNKGSYVLKGIHVNTSQRHLQQSIKFLRDLIPDYQKREIDWDENLLRISEQGFLSQLISKPIQKLNTELISLLDVEGSMIAFHKLLSFYNEKLKDKNILASHTSYYFHNYPVQNLFTNPHRTNSAGIEILTGKASSHIVIISDAGAARGFYNEERIEKTYEFLTKIRHHRVIWLNPMPKIRWKNTSAEFISYLVPMFEFSDTNFNPAIKLLKAKFNLSQNLQPYEI